MDVASSEQFLRQQLSYTRLLLVRLEAESALPMKRALTQSAMLCLDLGLSQYFSNIFNLPASDLQSLKQRLEGGAGHSSESIPSSEFIELMSDGRWLFEFASVSASLNSLPSVWSKANLGGGGVKQTATANLIASSSGSTRVPHWSEIDSEAILAWLSKAGELLDRYSSFSQEY